MNIFLISLAAFSSTLLGGLIALKFKNKLYLIIGFSAGAVISVSFFDLLPEAFELGAKYYHINTLLQFTAIGFFAYLILDRFVFFHGNHDVSCQKAQHSHNTNRGILGASSLILHSFLDGIAIGLAFQVSPKVGIIVAIAVLVHDFSDGINTINIILKNKGDNKAAVKWLIADACAPVLGVLSTSLFTLPEQALPVILSTFAGFFFYIGATDLLPESHNAHPKITTTLMTLLGAAVMYMAIQFAGI